MKSITSHKLLIALAASSLLLSSCSFLSTESDSNTQIDIQQPETQEQPATPSTASSQNSTTESAPEPKTPTEKAIADNDPSLCDRIEDQAESENCKALVAKAQKEAESTKESNDNDIYAKAKTEANPSLCTQIKATPLIAKCQLDATIQKSIKAKSTTPCKSLSNQDDKESCETQSRSLIGPTS